MNYLKTVGIIIYKKNIEEYSANIYILTKDYGGIKTVAEGINKPKSKLLSIIQPGNVGKFFLTTEENRYKLLSFLPYKIPVKVFRKFPYTYLWALRFLLFFNFLEISENFWQFIINLDKVLLKKRDLFVVIFLLKIFEELGMAPNLDTCEKCNQILKQFKFIYYQGAKLYCPNCKKESYERIDQKTYAQILNFLKNKDNIIKFKNKEALGIIKKILKSHLKNIYL